jgi:hypothetical protein
MHSVFKLPIPQNVQTAKYAPLSVDQVKVMRHLWKHVRLVVVDEYSMVSNTDLCILHLRLNEVPTNLPFCSTVHSYRIPVRRCLATAACRSAADRCCCLATCCSCRR